MINPSKNFPEVTKNDSTEVDLTAPFALRTLRNVTLNKYNDKEKVDGYFLPDGTTDIKNVMPIATLRLEPIEFVAKENQCGAPVIDDESARFARITDFQNFEKSTVDLKDTTTSDCLLQQGDKIVCSVKCSELQGHPSCTDGTMNVMGVVNLSIIQHADGFAKLQVSVAEGQYSFKASENFTEFVASAGIECCCFFKCNKGSSYSSMSMKYTTLKTMYAQDCVISIPDSVIDAVVYRKSVIKNEVSMSSFEESRNGSLVNLLTTIYDCTMSYAKLYFICYCNLYRCNPIFNCFSLCIPCTKFCSTCCERCFLFMICYKQYGFNKHHEVIFNVEDNFIIGKKYEKKTIEKAEKKEKNDEIIWSVCPIYCCGIFFQYPTPLPIADAFWKNTRIVYPCAKAGASPVDAKKEPEWMGDVSTENEIVISLQYRHVIDYETKTMKIIVNPQVGESMDDVYRNTRLFVSELIRLRGPIKFQAPIHKLTQRVIPTIDEVINSKKSTN